MNQTIPHEQSVPCAGNENYNDLKLKFDGLKLLLHCLAQQEPHRPEKNSAAQHLNPINRNTAENREISVNARESHSDPNISGGYSGIPECVKFYNDNDFDSIRSPTEIPTSQSAGNFSIQLDSPRITGEAVNLSFPRGDCEKCSSALQEVERLKGAVEQMMKWGRQILETLEQTQRTEQLMDSRLDLTEKCELLESQLKQVADMNEKWQKYSEEVETEKENLRGDVHEWESKYERVKANAVSIQEQMRHQLEVQRRRIESLQLSAKTSGEEVQRLRVELNESESRSWSRAQESWSNAHEQRSRAHEQRLGAGAMESSESELVSLLRAQVKQYEEDFNQERKEKEKLVSMLRQKDQQIQQLQNLQSRDSLNTVQNTLRQLSAGDMGHQMRQLSAGDTSHQMSQLSAGDMSHQMRQLSAGDMSQRQLSAGDMSHQMRQLSAGDMSHQGRSFSAGHALIGRTSELLHSAGPTAVPWDAVDGQQLSSEDEQLNQQLSQQLDQQAADQGALMNLSITSNSSDENSEH